MMRSSLLGILLLALVVVMAGCGSANTGRSDMPVKAGQGVNPKTGKATKTMEAGIEDTSPRK